MMIRSMIAAAMTALSFTATALAAGPDSETACLAAAAWNEARGRPRAEVVAVMHAIVNRSRHPAYAHTVCGVVLQRGQFQMSKQFRAVVASAERTGTARIHASKQADASALERIKEEADDVMHGDSPDATHGATHFYTPRLRVIMRLPRSPGWAKRIPMSASIGEFRFHRLKQVR